MASEPLKIVRCPSRRIGQALSLVLCDAPANQRDELTARLSAVDDPQELANEVLFAAIRGDELRGAAWGQRQSGKVACFWPPQLVAGEDERTGLHLAEAVVAALDETAVEMTQVLLPTVDVSVAELLTDVGFDHLADLLYLSCEANRFPSELPASELEFVTYDGSQRPRLRDLIEQTYEQTLDCVGLNGMRSIEDVITGYQGTGMYRPENWLIVRGQGRDVGVLLVAEHSPAQHWELMYMGVVPQVRGRKWGAQITEHAKWRARQRGVERIVLAVDATNTPALRMYRAAGFEIWDRRTAYARFPAKSLTE